MNIDLTALTATELDQLIAEALERRAKLAPEHPHDPPKGTMPAIIGPAWFTSMVDNGSLLQLRHPGLGWIAFVLPPEHRNMLMGFLLQQALIVKNKESEVAVATPAAAGSGGGTLH